jgi:hypothetical protein
MNFLFALFVVNVSIMTAITLKKLPDDLHREIKRLQLDMEDNGIRKSLEDIYIEMIQKGFEQTKKENPAK